MRIFFISILILFHIAYRLTRLIYDISQFVDENKPTITLILGYKFIDPVSIGLDSGKVGFENFS